MNENGLAVNASQRVPWWSFTKTLIATAVLKLVESGELQLDRYYQNYPFTVRQLLQHTSGLTDYGGLRAYHLAVENQEAAWSLEKLLLESRAEELLFEPGKDWAYSNIGYLFLKLLLEEHFQLELNEILHKLYLAELGLEDVQVISSVTEFNALNLTQIKDYDPKWVFHGLAVGSLASAVTFLHALSSGDILNENSFKEMLMPYLLGFEAPGRPWSDIEAGLGMFMGNCSGRYGWGHSGQGPESCISVSHFPSPQPTTYAVFTETNDIAVVENALARMLGR